MPQETPDSQAIDCRVYHSLWEEANWDVRRTTHLGLPSLLVLQCCPEPHPTTWNLQCWKASGQTKNKIGTQLYLLGCLKSSWSHSHFLTWPYPPKRQDTIPPTRGQAHVPPTRKPTQASEPTSPTRAQTPEARVTMILQPAQRRPHTQKVRQSETTKKYVVDAGTR